MGDVTILEPMSIGDIVDRSVRLYRRNFSSLIAVVAIPGLIGAFASAMFWFGYYGMLKSMSTGASLSPASLLAFLAGSSSYFLWVFTVLLSVSAVARVVGDHLLLGEVITFRKCLSAIRRRVGDITLMGLLFLAIAAGIGVAFFVVASVVSMAFIMVAAIFVAIGLPTWLNTLVVVLAIISAAAIVVIAALSILSRFVFMPQIVMIEGESAGGALGRAFRLGGKNWYRVGAIILFTYFVTYSLKMALTLPMLGVLQLAGLLTQEFFLQPGWSALYAGFDEISRLLVLPIWIISFTLLYFDSRVRKEGYDIEVLMRTLQPEAPPQQFYWQPVPPPPSRTEPAAPRRTFVQTSPLGLAGYQSPRPEAPRPAGDSAAGVSDSGSSVVQNVSDRCMNCGGSLQPRARFCHTCGNLVIGVNVQNPGPEVR
jgi:hypothetical protein